MAEFNKILIVLDVYNDFRDDPTHQPIEVRKAMEFAGKPESTQLILLGCGFEEFLHDTYSNFGPDALEQRKQFVADMQERLNVFAHVLSDKGYKVDSQVHWTYPRYSQVAQEARELDVDLVVQHANSRLPHERHNLSHDTWQLIQACDRPLLLIKDKEWPEQPVILATVDPVHSHHKPLGLDYKILSAAKEASSLTGGVVHVMHAYSESARRFHSEGSIRETHEKAMEELMADQDIPADAIHLVDETPVNAIMQCQEQLDVDVTVIGALSRSRLQEAIIGNTANRVLDYVKSDLIIVKPG